MGMDGAADITVFEIMMSGLLDETVVPAVATPGLLSEG